MRYVDTDIEIARAATQDLPELIENAETSSETYRKPFKVRKKPGANPIGKPGGGVSPPRKRLRKVLRKRPIMPG
jgi:hypothetical protein